MNRKESLALFLRGKDAWNDWAIKKLAEKKLLEKKGIWHTFHVTQTVSGINRTIDRLASDYSEVQKWLDDCYVDLSEMLFYGIDASIKLSDVNYEIVEPVNDNIHVTYVNKFALDVGNYIFPGDIDFFGTIFCMSTYFNNTEFHGLANFRQSHFYRNTSFFGAKFKSKSIFERTAFHDHISFEKCEFNEDANFASSKLNGLSNFVETTFGDDTSFTGSKFYSAVSFEDAKYKAGANFRSSKFEKKADFSQSEFQGYVDFTKAKFSDEAVFAAMRVEKGFNLKDTAFISHLPSFIQAHFSEAPRLDHISVLPPPKYFHLNRLWHLSKRICQRHYLNSNEPHRIKWRLPRYNLVEWLRLRLRYSWRNFKNHRRDPDEEARYRALKRLAIQAHDHENELEFFASELRARRHLTDSPNILTHGPKSFLRYLAGISYDIFSDFGRSIWRPLTLFAVIFYAFTQLYIHQATALFDGNCANSDKMTASYAVYTIAAKNSLLFLGTDRTDKIKRAYTCLYGAAPIYETPNPAGNDRIKTGYENVTPTSRHMAPNVPWAVSASGTAHSILSLILIFLLLLAIRNQFKIK